MASPHAVAHRGSLVGTPAVRTITAADLTDALAKRHADFRANPTQRVVPGLIDRVLGPFLASSAFGYDVLLLYRKVVA